MEYFALVFTLSSSNECLSRRSNGCESRKDEILAYLRAIAESFSEERMRHNIQTFKESLVWLENEKLQNYFKNHYEPHLKVGCCIRTNCTENVFLHTEKLICFKSFAFMHQLAHLKVLTR